MAIGGMFRPQLRKSPVRADAADPDAHAEWLRRVAAHGDSHAFTQLFDHYAPRLKTYMMRLGCAAADAEELAQEVMVTVWQRAASFDAGKGRVSTWIFTIARNRRIDGQRRDNWPAAAAIDISSLDELLPDHANDSEDAAIVASSTKRAVAYMDALPESQQQVLRLAFFEEKTHQQIAAELGVPLGTIKSRIRDALRKMQEWLDP